MLETVGSEELLTISDFGIQELWRAIKTRDFKFASRFFYGVKSTRIYCRPTCSSRKPRSIDGVAFFATPHDATKAGYRPCTRCKPDVRNGESSQARMIQRICEYIAENSNERMPLAKLSNETGMSPFYLQRTFKRITGLSPREYTEAVRLGRLKMSLKTGRSVRKSTYEAGYNTSAWLYFRPGEKLGMSPSRYKKGGEGVTISYTVSESPLGKLLVAATGRGVCFVSIAESTKKLMTYLRSEFPKAKFDTGSSVQNKNLSLSVEKIMEYLTRGTDLENSNLPLELQATTFQWRVWKELRAIPYGRVRSYSEVARRIGKPRATRAVANACASNPVPLVVPCHRVVPKTGGIGEYGLGVERKRKLLEREGVDVTRL